MLSRADLERSLKVLYGEQGQRELPQILISANILSVQQVQTIKNKLRRFYQGSTMGDFSPHTAEQKSFIQAVWYPKLSRYEVVEPLAEGGMGFVFRALDKTNSRSVAIKFLKDKNKSSRQRFLREIKIVKKLSHPNILPILDAGQEEEYTFFTMPIVYGQDLDDWVYEKGPLPPKKAMEVLRVITKAVRFAHSKRVIHRDLKPSNIMINQQGKPLLTDFGLAKQMSAQTVSITRTGSLIGTPEYMPPEQACGASDWIGYSADIYGLGAILYFCLTGQPPFTGDNLVKLIQKVVHHSPAPIEEFRDDVPTEVLAICRKCLAKHPQDRYESAKKLIREIDSYLKEKGNGQSFFFFLRGNFILFFFFFAILICLTLGWIFLLKIW